jgi:aspartyl-tRNA(Asn)/glutamyl-tRNA(Gln) amidotransferase subunit A
MPTKGLHDESCVNKIAGIKRLPIMHETPPGLAGITELVNDITQGRLSPAQIVDTILARIERMNPSLNAYITISADAREDARKAEKAVAGKTKLGLLHGIPLSIKDIILCGKMPTTGGSKVFGEGLCGRDALVVRRLRRAGAVVVGKNNLHEFAFGVTNENAHFGAARNPWNQERIPGGSSGGSAVAVAAGLCCASIGTDTRGSIRIPSACCGTTGLKPTLGLVPTKGVIPLSWTLDHVGPMTRNVEDAARLLQVMSGRRNRDYLRDIRNPIGSLRLGVCEYYLHNLDPEIEAVVRRAIQVFEDAGVRVEEIAIDYLEEALNASDMISRAEAVTYHDRCLREQPESYGAAVRQRLETGYSVTAIEYVKARRVRRHMIDEFKKVFRKVDCLIAAVLPALPPPVRQDFVEINGRREPIVHSFVRLNAPQNVGGVPALALAGGFSRSGLPIGFQLIAGHYQESVLFRLGAYFQRVSDWHLRTLHSSS